MDQPIILFDGICNLCNGAVQFIIRHDSKKQFMFASLQSDEGQKCLGQFNLPKNDLNSFILIDKEKVFTRSSGALRVLKKLNGLWPLLYAFIIIPTFIRDNIYNGVAKNRYKWFGKKAECMIPTSELKARFLN